MRCDTNHFSTLQTDPAPDTYTLFLKNGKTTTLIYASPSTTLDAIKSELIVLLSENARHIDLELPEKVSEINLAATIDPGQDVKRGFRILEDQDMKKTTVLDAGLQDGNVVAWNLGGKEFRVEVPVEEEYDDE